MPTEQRSNKQVESTVSDPRLVEERRKQILDAAIKLFSTKGYYRTTILDIAKEAKISSGLIYQYFKEKDDVLYLSLLVVLEAYEHEVPPLLAEISNPVGVLCEALRAYCRVVDRLRDATILAYRSTKSLRPERRIYIKQGETRTNDIIRGHLDACIEGGYMRPINADLMVYQYVMFCHTWALKHWAFRKKYSVDEYVNEGIKLLVEPFMTARGKRALKSFHDQSAAAGSKARKSAVLSS